MTSAAIGKWKLPSVPIPFNFLGTPKHSDLVAIRRKEIKESFAFNTVSITSGYSSTVGRNLYYVHVEIEGREVRIRVSQKIYPDLEEGGLVLVRYQRGRWNGALKVKIA